MTSVWQKKVVKAQARVKDKEDEFRTISRQIGTVQAQISAKVGTVLRLRLSSTQLINES
jgi:hypothetical protein